MDHVQSMVHPSISSLTDPGDAQTTLFHQMVKLTNSSSNTLIVEVPLGLKLPGCSLLLIGHCAVEASSGQWVNVKVLPFREGNEETQEKTSDDDTNSHTNDHHHQNTFGQKVSLQSNLRIDILIKESAHF